MSWINLKITDLGEPTESRDGATKYYVDQRFNNLRDLIRGRSDS